MAASGNNENMPASGIGVEVELQGDSPSKKTWNFLAARDPCLEALPDKKNR